MLPPATMLRNKKPAGAFVALACVLVLAGCAPSGTTLVREAKQLIAQGRYTESIQKLNLALSLVPTNALVWNELGLAYHYAGNISNAVEAYRKAVRFNNNLAEARYNLGCLLFEQGKLDAARSELTTYTMQRPHDVGGWLKLGSVQLRLRDVAGAEKSFGEALKLDAKNPVALNGLGLALLQKNRPKEAAEAFSNALEADPDFGPAMLNLAIVSHIYLHNRVLAVEKYRQYAALEPRPPDANTVLGIAEQLERELLVTQRAAAPEPGTQAATQPGMLKPQQAQTGTVAVAVAPRAESGVQPAKTSPPPETVVAVATPARQIAPARTTEPTLSRPVFDTATAQTEPAAQVTSTVPTPSRATGPRPVEPEKPGLLDRLNPLNWFRGGPKPRPTPLPPRLGSAQSTADTARQPTAQVQPAPAPQPGAPVVSQTVSPKAEGTATQPDTVAPAPVQIPRYVYGRIAKPNAGDAQKAQVALAKGVEAHRAKRLTEAIEAYKQAIQADPSCFEAYYNLGVAAHELKSYPTALAAYETALAIVPDSTLARYNFALALRDAGYLLDAAAELQKVVTIDPTDTRAHLALGNLYAQRLGNRAQARVHYLRVLELEPAHPQATAIRYWLAANPG
jgi:tetratricopeptide (TPR) repeat protein